MVRRPRKEVYVSSGASRPTGAQVGSTRTESPSLGHRIAVTRAAETDNRQGWEAGKQTQPGEDCPMGQIGKAEAQLER